MRKKNKNEKMNKNPVMKSSYLLIIIIHVDVDSFDNRCHFSYAGCARREQGRKYFEN